MVEQFLGEDWIVKIALSLAPPLIWLSLFLFEDNKPEPKKMVAKVFLAGGLGAVVFAAFSLYLRPLLSDWVDLHSPFPVFIFALLEEAMKFASVYLAVRWSGFLDEPVDRMIYMINGAMGFAAVENILLAATVHDPLQTMIFRFFGAVLMHALASGMVGFYWAEGLTGNGLLATGALHGLFNIIVLTSSPAHGLWFAAIIALFIVADFDIIKRKWNITNSRK